MNPKGLSALSVEAGNGKLSSSPLLRKFIEAANISLMQNDDEAELLEQRKLAEKELLDSVEDPLQMEYSDPKVSKKKTRKHFRSTVATNLDTLNLKAEEDVYIAPSFLRLASMTGDSRSGDYNFLSHLKARAGTSEPQLSTVGSYWSERTVGLNQDSPVTYCKVALPDLADNVICPTFSAFSFTKWSVDDGSQSPEPPSPLRPNLEHMFDMEAVPEPVPLMDTSSVPIDGDDDADTGFDVDETLAMASCAAPRRPPDGLVDLRNHLSTIPQEYSYFKPESLSLWAGQGHRKTKLPISSATHYGVKSRPIKNVEVDGTSTIDNAKFTQSKSIQFVSKTIRSSWSPKKTT